MSKRKREADKNIQIQMLLKEINIFCDLLNIESHSRIRKLVMLETSDQTVQITLVSEAKESCERYLSLTRDNPGRNKDYNSIYVLLKKIENLVTGFTLEDRLLLPDSNNNIQLQTHLKEINFFCDLLKIESHSRIRKLVMLKTSDQSAQITLLAEAKKSCERHLSLTKNDPGRNKNHNCIYILLKKIENLVTGSPLEKDYRYRLFSIITESIPICGDLAKVIADYAISDKSKSLLKEFNESELQPLICSLENSPLIEIGEKSNVLMHNIDYANIILSHFFNEDEKVTNPQKIQSFLKWSKLPNPGERVTMNFLRDLFLEKHCWRYVDNYFIAEKLTFSAYFTRVIERAYDSRGSRDLLIQELPFELADVTNILERFELLLNQLSPAPAHRSNTLQL